MHDLVGQILAGKYRVERVLGQGGMGVVVQAIHLQLGQRVAIKFVLPEVLHNPEVRGRFLREAQAAAILKSAHVARVVDIGTLENGAPYMVMEYLDGEDLASLLRRVGPIPVATAAAWLLEACEAVAEAHALGIIHRDLKPANLFLSYGAGGFQSIKVFDFGISKITSSSGFELSLTRTTAVMGSPNYASPEQLRATKNVDHRTDIWALGVTLYQLVSGDMPFKADTLPELSIKVAIDPPPPLPPQLRVPAAFEQIIRRCLEKEPGRRYASVAALAEALGPFAPEGRAAAERVRRTGPVVTVVGPETTMGGSAGEISSPRSRGRTLGIAGAIVLTSVVAGAIIVSGRSGSAAKGEVVDTRLPAARLAVDTPPVTPPVVAQIPAAASPPAVTPPVVAQIPAAASPPAVTPPVTPPVAAQIPAAAPPPVVVASTPDAGVETSGPTGPRPSPGARYRDLVNAAQRLGKSSCSSAVRIYETAIDVNPRGAEALTGLGACLLELRDYDRAISNFRAALTISRRNPEALIGAAEAYQLKGNVSAAIAHYKGYLEVAPRGARAELARRSLAKLDPGKPE